MLFRRAGRAGVLLAATLPVTVLPATAQEETRRLLRRVADVSREDLRRLEAGSPIVRVVETENRAELTLVYAVRVRAPVSFILARARERHILVDDVDAPNRRGIFGGSPAESDFRGLSLDRSEVRQLRRCRVADCEHKLSEESIRRLHEQVDWSGDAVDEQANAFFRRELASLAADYAMRGDAAAPVYADKREPLSVSDGLDALLSGAVFLRELDPAFHRHLSEYPRYRSPTIEDRFSWTLEDLGMKTVLSLHHVAIRPASESGAALVGAKRLYSNHYLQAGLRVLHIAPASRDPQAADSYVTVVTRLRFDGEVGGVRRTAMERRLEANADAVLLAVRDHLEAEFIQP